MPENHLYGIIYYQNSEGHGEEWVSSVTIAESYHDAEKAAEENRQKHWATHSLHSITYLTPINTEAGAVFMVSTT